MADESICTIIQIKLWDICLYLCKMSSSTSAKPAMCHGIFWVRLRPLDPGHSPPLTLLCSHTILGWCLWRRLTADHTHSGHSCHHHKYITNIEIVLAKAEHFSIFKLAIFHFLGQSPKISWLSLGTFFHLVTTFWFFSLKLNKPTRNLLVKQEL